MKKAVWKKVSIGALAFVIVFFCGLVANSIAGLTPEQARELGEIRKAINAKGGKWKAGETSVFKLSREAKKRLCGVLFSGEQGMVSSESTTEPTFTIDTDSLTAFDWRDQYPYPVTPIKDQGNCGSCWAFAAVGAMESTLIVSNNLNGNDLSEQFVVSCDTSNFGCNGGYMNRVYDFLTEKGTTDEDCFLYTSGLTGTSPRCKKGCHDWPDRVEKLTGWQWVNNDTNEIKATVYSNGPVATTMDVFYDFYSYGGGVYEYSSGEYMGGHAVIIIGWGIEENVEYWICKNSWGTDWGEEGYFKIKWGECGIGGNIAKYSYTPCPDNDNDDYADEACGGQDCNDNNSLINPGIEEECDGIDNNCDGKVDDKGKPCEIGTDCCSGKCKGKPGGKTCK